MQRIYKNKKFVILVSIILFLLLILLIINLKKNNFQSRENVTNNMKIDYSNRILSYDEYAKLFENMVNDVKIDGFYLKASTLGGNVTLVDKEITFGKRKYLTIDGELNMKNTKPTEEFYVLENKTQTIQLTISILYCENYLGDNLLGWSNNYGFNDLNKKLVQSTNYATLSYKNLLIIVHQNAIDKAEVNITENFLKEIVIFLQGSK